MLSLKYIQNKPGDFRYHNVQKPDEEASNAVVFLVSDKALCMTGSVIVVDGGYLAM